MAEAKIVELEKKLQEMDKLKDLTEKTKEDARELTAQVDHFKST